MASGIFKYTPIDRSSRQIRLLKFIPNVGLGDNLIRCYLETYEISQCPSFIALSYTWGEDSPGHKITLNRRPYFVRDNLWAVLCVLKSLIRPDLEPTNMPSITGSMPIDQQFNSKKLWNRFWVDAICINQQGDFERGHQVNMMRDIFSSADSVIAWLGPEYDDSNLAMHSLFHLPDRDWCPGYWGEYEQELKKSEKAIANLFMRPYWSRMWIIQEFILPSHIFILCGQLSFWRSDSWLNFTRLPETATEQKVVGKILPGYRSYWRSCSPYYHQRILHLLLSTFSKWSCSDPRDKVFALLGLIGDITSLSIPRLYPRTPVPLLADYTISPREL
ncbi:heterokaryon incompatibility protein-domain-containing protein [Hypoxylon trugodes]|uniref:heterokaryon incompatibility protein-domain-containing protein n=1 Tax=Hypoxylon trugodes TaxID=326681 RepID=UPI002194A396|nr:heterokaryon incompatibility protein-domain-containing protein [Hypoxylon trugodes]KAI1388424.1 heterokaryon incompatibility protein-domain-containing protein [Hypoxylon trugodes]